MIFKACHPAVHFVYFTAAIAASAAFSHPCFLLCAYVCAFACNVFFGGKRALMRNMLLAVLSGAFALFYAGYNHFGVTALAVNFIGNKITLEALIRGTVTGIKSAAVLMWLDALCAVMTTDEIVYLFGKAAPKLSLYIAAFLRMIPCIREERRLIKSSRRSAGVPERAAAAFFTRTGILISRTAERLSESAGSMRSRGFTLKGRTAYSIYRFDNRDRALVIFIFTLITMLLMAYILGETAALLYTAGFAHTLYGLAKGLKNSGATLTVALYVYAKEQGEFDVAFAIAAILMLLTMLINLAADLAGRYFRRKQE